MDFLSESLKGRLLFAIPKKGRLYEHCLTLLSGELHLTRMHGKTQADCRASNDLNPPCSYLHNGCKPTFYLHHYLMHLLPLPNPTSYPFAGHDHLFSIYLHPPTHHAIHDTPTRYYAFTILQAPTSNSLALTDSMSVSSAITTSP